MAVWLQLAIQSAMAEWKHQTGVDADSGERSQTVHHFGASPLMSITDALVNGANCRFMRKLSADIFFKFGYLNDCRWLMHCSSTACRLVCWCCCCCSWAFSCCCRSSNLTICHAACFRKVSLICSWSRSANVQTHSTTSIELDSLGCASHWLAPLATIDTVIAPIRAVGSGQCQTVQPASSELIATVTLVFAVSSFAPTSTVSSSWRYHLRAMTSAKKRILLLFSCFYCDSLIVAMLKTHNEVSRLLKWNRIIKIAVAAAGR